MVLMSTPTFFIFISDLVIKLLLRLIIIIMDGRIKTQDIAELTILFVVSMAVKMLLIPGYYSTDFDVHQNWLRITYNLPMEQWYFDTQSKWTLDYPPLFAYFEYALAQISALINPQIAANINSMASTVHFQRATVMISELPFLLVLYLIIKKVNLTLVLAYFSIPFIILDNIHFQYNIIMQALFLLSVYFIQEGKFLWGAFAFSTLLNFKHIYLYASIAFVAYLLKQYVLKGQSLTQKITRLARLGIVTLIPFVVSFLPFVIIGGFKQIEQIFSRLFPFERGLIHDYWAPNFWAIYYFIDKLANILFARFLPTSNISFRQVSTDLHQLKVLPTISPFITTILILFFTAPIVVKYLKKGIKFHKLVFICGMLFFMFGYHVHEKAITPYIGLLLVFAQNREKYYLDSAIFINILNLLPLLIGPNEKMLRLILPLLWIAISSVYRKLQQKELQTGVRTVGIMINIYHELIHPFNIRKNLEFLPLLLNSVFSAAFNVCWLTLIYQQQMIAPSEQTQQYQKIGEQQT